MGLGVLTRLDSTRLFLGICMDVDVVLRLMLMLMLMLLLRPAGERDATGSSDIMVYSPCLCVDYSWMENARLRRKRKAHCTLQVAIPNFHVHEDGTRLVGTPRPGKGQTSTECN